MPKHSSATKALNHLGCDNLTKRRFHRLILFFEALNSLIDWHFKFHSYKDTHNYNTRRRNNINFVSPNHVALGATDDWNILSDEVKGISDILAFKRHMRSVS